MQLPTIITSRNPAADFKPSDILDEAKEENFARVDAKELPDLLIKMENYDGDALTRLAMRLMATRLCARLNSLKRSGRNSTSSGSLLPSLRKLTSGSKQVLRIVAIACEFWRWRYVLP